MYSPGDLIVQCHQSGAQPCLVVATTDASDVVVVWSPAKGRYRRVFSSAYDLVQPATEGSRAEAVDRSLSEAYARTTAQKHW